MLKIAPSILSADFARLGEHVAAVEPVSDWLHVDVMDGHFVPNLTIGPPVVRSLRRATSLPLDCHLMITDPDAYIEPFADAGADSITVHVEALPDPRGVLTRIRSLGLRRGLTLNPATPFENVDPYLEDVDVLLVMTVHPGFGGQSFRDDQLPKIEQAAETVERRGIHVDIQVDGGVGPSTVRRVVDAGATVLVAGSSIFGAADPREATVALREMAGGPVHTPTDV